MGDIFHMYYVAEIVDGKDFPSSESDFNWFGVFGYLDNGRTPEEKILRNGPHLEEAIKMLIQQGDRPRFDVPMELAHVDISKDPIIYRTDMPYKVGYRFIENVRRKC
ncbi:MAG: hypothetical protein ABIH34_03380 [Nanoarchaeota archaeon]